MKKSSSSQLGVGSARVLLAFVLCSAGALLAILSFAGTSSRPTAEGDQQLRDMPVPGGEADDLERMQMEWHNRVTYPTGRFNPEWIRLAAAHDFQMARRVPLGVRRADLLRGKNGPLALDVNAFTALGPQPERMTGCQGCFDYGKTEGRVNAVVVDPTTTITGSIVAYIGTDGGGVWKTTNCCSAATSWTVLTDDAAVSTTSIDTLTIDPNNHNTIYAGTGDLNFGSFSYGSQGILRSTDGGMSWTVLGATVFGAPYPEPAGQFPQYPSRGQGAR